jgi:hypothetical protein
VAGSGASIGQRGASRGGIAVLDPLLERGSGKAADVGCQMGFSADELAKMDELIRTHGIGIVAMARWRVCGLAHGPEICAARAFFSGANSIAPVVTIGKTPTGKADH